MDTIGTRTGVSISRWISTTYLFIELSFDGVFANTEPTSIPISGGGYTCSHSPRKRSHSIILCGEGLPEVTRGSATMALIYKGSGTPREERGELERGRKARGWGHSPEGTHLKDEVHALDDLYIALNRVDGTENGCRAVSGDFVHLGSGYPGRGARQGSRTWLWASVKERRPSGLTNTAFSPVTGWTVTNVLDATFELTDLGIRGSTMYLPADGNHFRLKGDDSLSTSQLKQRKHSSNRPTTVTDLLHSQNLKLSINRKQVKYRRPSTLKEADYRGWALNKPLSAGARQIWGSIRDYFSAIPPVAQGLDMRLPPPGLPRVSKLNLLVARRTEDLGLEARDQLATRIVDEGSSLFVKFYMRCPVHFPLGGIRTQLHDLFAVAELEDGCTSCTVGGMTSSVLALPLELGAIRVEGWTG
ncbi:hypothetical protein DFP72DRAFT_852882 [Ephemerocybe angulata]|uniref:Uncharacterized protein n=1 Tax=Ephemerocybe angulata TaxID=980116 RepID=A0A8H6M2B1_9AGAR|nr:hypothetical protein DFP72DRAFT_852882 [Tulosesus angulatus]